METGEESQVGEGYEEGGSPGGGVLEAVEIFVEESSPFYIFLSNVFL